MLKDNKTSEIEIRYTVEQLHYGNSHARWFTTIEQAREYAKQLDKKDNFKAIRKDTYISEIVD